MGFLFLFFAHMQQLLGSFLSQPLGAKPRVWENSAKLMLSAARCTGLLEVWLNSLPGELPRSCYVKQKGAKGDLPAWQILSACRRRHGKRFSNQQLLEGLGRAEGGGQGCILQGLEIPEEIRRG